ncbi:MAG: nucleoside triphosphate pyrophosphatase [Myxococcales bacterium]|nr:Maf family protein [Polyangiaceae bacterium]MDW8250904.1 nucleoside triphosphate pyrophosphatase [Myxococcales bacterium]
MFVPPLLLASASPRRREILATLGLPFEAQAVDANEDELPGEPPERYLERIVAAKLRLAREIAARRGISSVLVADTTVILDGRMLAKPQNPGENRAMIAALASRVHQVKTRFAALGPKGERARTVSTQVRFRPLSPGEIDSYVATGEGRDKAGGYAIQGIGAFLVESIKGSYSAVVGLPACEVVQALVEVGAIPSYPLPLSEVS